MNEIDMKREDRATLNVSRETRDDILKLLFKIQAERGQRITQDDVVRFLFEYHAEHAEKDRS
jgi:hypothetical protein